METVSYNEMETGLLQRVVSCEDVDDPASSDAFDGWALVRPYQERTWFSYPANVHSYTFTVVDNDRTREDGCDDDASGFRLQESTTHTQMNAWGVMTARTFTVGNDVTSTSFSEWVIDEDAWFFAPQRTETQSCVDGVCQSRRSRRVFDPQTHAVQESFREPDATDDTYLHSSFEYTARGNLESVTVAGLAGADARTTTTEWDPNGVVALSSTNALGHTSYVLSDPRSGVTWASVEPNGVTQRVTFDGFYRPVVRNRLDSPAGTPDGAASSTLYGPGDAALGATFELIEQQLGQSTRTQIGPTGKVLQVTWKGVVPSEVFPVPVQGPTADDIYFRNEYDAWGRLARTSHNTFVGSEPAYWTEIDYDESSRKRRAVVVDAAGVELLETEQRWDVTLSATVPWGGTVMPRQSFYTDEEGNQQSTVTDHKGRVIYSVDAVGTGTCYAYGPFGRLQSVQRNCAANAAGPQPSTSYTYDALGRILTETDPAFGTKVVDYTRFGEVEATVDAKGQVTFFDYDDLGRKVQQVAPEGTSSWTYDTSKLGLLHSSTGPDGIDRTYRYDAFNRLGLTQTDLPAFGLQSSGDSVTVEYQYDVGNRVSSMEFEDGIGLTFDYDLVGYHRATLFDSPSGQELVWGWEYSDENTSLRVESFGTAPVSDRTRTTRWYDAATGRLESSTTDVQGSNDQAFSFGWTPAGDLEYRLDSVNGQAEEFEHDALHRLLESEVDGYTRTYAYDALGNFTQKDGIGSYHYDSDGARLEYTTNGVFTTTYSHDANGAVEQFGDTRLSWTSFGKVRSIETNSGARRMSYDADGSRVIRQTDEEVTVTAHGLYERRYDGRGNLEEGRFKATNAAGAVVGEFRFGYTPATKPSQPGTWTRTATRYIHDDHLGSAGLVTDENANEVDRVAYDAWGRARDATHWNVYLSDSATDELPIGFTGHQAELDGGLINMGGRMYDPGLGRFMSVDPVIENAVNAQTWNAYSYVQNRPLSATDPTGLAADDGGGGGSEDDISKAANAAGNPGDSCSSGRSGKVTVTVCSDGAMPAEPIEPIDPTSGPVGGAFWGSGGGSGVGMRNRNELDVLNNLDRFANREALQDELDFWTAVGGQCSAHGNMMVCGFKPLAGEKSIQEAMAGAFALLNGLNVAGEGIAIATPLGDGVDIVNAIAEGDGEAAALAVGMAVLGLVPGVKGAKAAKKAADAVDAAHDATKAADAVHDASKAAKGVRGGAPGSRPGQPFTQAGKQEVWKANASTNGGVAKCENCGVEVVKPQRHQGGISPPRNEGHVDHVIRQRNGGSGTPDNGQILCRDCNLDKL